MLVWPGTHGTFAFHTGEHLRCASTGSIRDGSLGCILLSLFESPSRQQGPQLITTHLLFIMFSAVLIAFGVPVIVIRRAFEPSSLLHILMLACDVCVRIRQKYRAMWCWIPIQWTFRDNWGWPITELSYCIGHESDYQSEIHIWRYWIWQNDNKRTLPSDHETSSIYTQWGGVLLVTTWTELRGWWVNQSLYLGTAFLISNYFPAHTFDTWTYHSSLILRHISRVSEGVRKISVLDNEHILMSIF